MDEDNKKNTIKNLVSAHGSVASMASKKVIEKRQLPTIPSNGNGSKAEVHGVSTFARQVVHETKIPLMLMKTKSASSSTSNPPTNKVISGTQIMSALGDMKKMIDKALKARLYFLQQTGPHQFLIGGDSPDHKYRVTIGSQRCSCGKDGLCVHILFVMLRVFQVSITDPILAKRSLRNFEVETLLRNFNARRRSKIKSLSRSTSFKKDNLKLTNFDATDSSSTNAESLLVTATDKEVSENMNMGNEPNDEETCPICLLELVEGESLTECKNCQNKYHQHCIDIWTQECSQQKEPVVCPLCRAAWIRIRSPSDNKSNTLESTLCGASVLDELMPDDRIMASEWLKVFSVNIVQKLLSKNWTEREIGLRHCLEEVLGSKPNEEHHESCPLSTIESAICVLSHMVLDPVYKVFVAALRAFRSILSYTVCQNESQQSHLRFILEPFIKSLFVKCSDGNKKTGLLAISALEEFIKGQEGELAVGKEIFGTPGLLPIGDLDYLLTLTLSNNDPSLIGVEDWQMIYGKLIILDRLVQLFPQAFLYSESELSQDLSKNANNSNRIHCPHFLEHYPTNLHITNKDLFLDFSLKYLPHSHVRISKTSRNIVFCITKLNAYKSRVAYHHILSHVSNSPLDSSLKEALLSKLLKIEEDLDIPMGRGRNHSPDKRRRSVPSIQEERTSCNKIRPSSSRVSWSRGSFKSASEYGRRIKSSIASPVQDSSSKRISIGKRRCLKKNLSISDDSVFTKSSDSSQLTPESLSFKNEATERCHEFSRCNSVHYLRRCISEYSLFSLKQYKDKSIFERSANGAKFKDAATSTSPPIASPADPLESSSSKNFKENPSKLRIRREAAHSRHFSGGSVKDLEDRTILTSYSEKVSFKSEIATTPHSSPQSTSEERNFCKEEVDKEEAEALARALDISDMHQEALPFVPGLSVSNPQSMSKSLSEELKEMKISWTSFTSGNPTTVNSADAAAKSTSSTYEENSHWKRGPIIGSGAACTCFQARDIKTGTLMAVKLISFCRNTIEEQNKVKKLIVDEVQTLAQLNHPNIVRILGATLQSTHVFMFFEWMPGRSITSLLELYGPFSETVVIKYTLQILRGLLYLHDNHILHRDLKGANILVDSTGQKLRIGDFGTSARLSSSQTLRGEFQGQLLGTVAFMAPEVLRGADYGRSCDIWSMGCCMIEMLTGSPPWLAKHLSNHLALMFKIASSEKPPPIPEVSDHALKDFLLRCLDINPSDRPAAKDLLKHPLFRI